MKGNIVSKTSARYIQNLLTATAATKTEDSEDSSDDTDAEQRESFDFKAGNMPLARQTLAGMSTRSADEGVKAMGRHARTIRLGRSLRGSPPREANVARLIEERFWDDGSFPRMKEIQKTVVLAKPPLEKRPAPFQGNLGICDSDDHRLRPAIINMVG